MTAPRAIIYAPAAGLPVRAPALLTGSAAAQLGDSSKPVHTPRGASALRFRDWIRDVRPPVGFAAISLRIEIGRERQSADMSYAGVTSSACANTSWILVPITVALVQSDAG